ncbi:MAG: adenylate/guanylate cyclase domain-containing protein [Myxococcota bacterium]|jgi:adenylate cyclase
MGFHPVVQALFDWLVDGAPGAPTPMAVLARLGPDLVAAGVPLARMTAFVRTLHPSVVGRSFTWLEGKAEVEVREASWALLDSVEFKASPVARVFQTGELVRRRLGGEVDFADLSAMAAQGFTDYAAFPLKFMGGSVHAITFATRAPGGFTDAHLDALGHVVRPLSRVGETLALMRTAVNLLNAYVGNDAGDRILKGQIQRGDTQNIDCVIWFSDLRGFTRLSGERTPKEIISVLNEFFDCQVPAIERAGGQVLKFIGDGLLAIFPLGRGRSTAEVGGAAVRASREALEALAALNQARAGRGESPLAFGVALHVGEVAYGNIGGAGRLDFTAIGPAVNLASRIEGLTGKLGKPVLLSGALAAALPARGPCVGAFELKGVTGATEVYEP